MVITTTTTTTASQKLDSGLESSPLRLASDVAESSALKNAVLDPSVKTSSELNAKTLKKENTLEQQFQEAETSINESLMKQTNQALRFRLDEETGRTVIEIIDKKTDEIIRQVPPQEFLEIVYNFNKAASLVLKDLPKFI